MTLKRLTRLFRCRHRDVRGIANYYDRDAGVFLQLVECQSCNDVLIIENGG